MTRYRILPYRQGSKSAKSLAEALGGKVLKLEGSKYKPKSADIVINWGSVVRPDYLDTPTTYLSVDFVNEPQVIRKASNKLLFFQNMRDNNLLDYIPQFWENGSDISEDCYPVVCRTELAGHSGSGIVMAGNPSELVLASLYVRYMKKKDEYRVHLGMKEDEAVVIVVQKKARRLDTPDNEVNWQIRNHSNGFVYVREGVNPPSGVIEAAQKTFKATGLDFGAVDVIFNEQKGKAYVLEINCAPGLEGQTIQDYASFFKQG